MSRIVHYDFQGNEIEPPTDPIPTTNADSIRNASVENLARFLASVSKCRNCLAKRELCDVSTTTCAMAWCNWLMQEADG